MANAPDTCTKMPLRYPRSALVHYLTQGMNKERIGFLEKKIIKILAWINMYKYCWVLLISRVLFFSTFWKNWPTVLGFILILSMPGNVRSRLEFLLKTTILWTAVRILFHEYSTVVWQIFNKKIKNFCLHIIIWIKKCWVFLNFYYRLPLIYMNKFLDVPM